MITFDGETVASIIRRHRLARCWPLQGLATRIGVSHEAIRVWEDGKHLPQAGNLTALAAVLEIDPRELLEAARRERIRRAERRADWQLERLSAAPIPADRAEVGRRIREARLGAGKTQWDVALFAGTTAPQVCAWEYGRTACRPHYLARVADLCGVSVAYLRGEVGR